MAYSTTGKIEDLTSAVLKNVYLKGLGFVDELGAEYEDEWYEHFLNVAIDRFTEYTNVDVLPIDHAAELHDYYINDYQQYAYLQLYHYPVIKKTLDPPHLIEGNTITQSPYVAAVYPTGQTVTVFPAEWVRVDIKHGNLQLVPTQGSLSQVILGQGGSYLPILYQGLGYLPQLFQVTYTSGFETGLVPKTVIDAIAKMATIDLLTVVGDTIRPTGITSQSYSIDGMSQSRGFQNSPEFAPVFSGRIAQLQRELYGDPRLGKDGSLDEIRNFHRGMNMWVMS